MAEYIEREAALRTAHIMRPEDKCLEAAIANIPAADVVPVVHGKPVTKIRTVTLTGYHEELGHFAEDGANLYRKK